MAPQRSTQDGEDATAMYPREDLWRAQEAFTAAETTTALLA